MRKRWVVLLVIISCFGGCLAEKEEKEVNINIENEDVLVKESKEVAEGYGLELTKALELVKGLKREGLTVQDLNETADIAAQESVNVGMEFSDGTRKNIDTLIKDYKTENSEEIKANNLKDSDIKEIVTDSVKSGFIQSVIAEDGVEDTVLFVNNSKLDNEVKDRVGYNSLLEKFNKKEITMEEIRNIVSEEYKKMEEKGLVNEIATKFPRRELMKGKNKRSRFDSTEVKKYAWEMSIPEYINYLNSFANVKKGDVVFVRYEKANTCNKILNFPMVTWFDCDYLKSELQHTLLVTRDFSELINKVAEYEMAVQSETNETVLKIKADELAKYINETDFLIANTGMQSHAIGIKSGNGVLYETITSYVMIREKNLSYTPNYTNIVNNNTIKNFDWTRENGNIAKDSGEQYSSDNSEFFEHTPWYEVKISSVAKHYRTWGYLGMGTKKICGVKIKYPKFGFSTHRKDPTDSHRDKAVSNARKKLKDRGWLPWDNCATYVFDAWAGVDSGKWTIDGLVPRITIPLSAGIFNLYPSFDEGTKSFMKQLVDVNYKLLFPIRPVENWGWGYYIDEPWKPIMTPDGFYKDENTVPVVGVKYTNHTYWSK